MCNDETLAKLENISFEFPNDVILEKGKKIKLSVIANIIPGATAGKYKQVTVLKSCVGHDIKTKQEIKCSPENILGRNLNIAGHE